MACSLLLATLPTLDVPHFLDKPIAHAARHTEKRLVIVLFAEHFDASWDALQRILTFTYVQATKVAWEKDNILLEVDVLLKRLDEDLDIGQNFDMCYRIDGDTILPPSIASVPLSVLPVSAHPPSASIPPSPTPTYSNTALGGTFDHLHAGHKILLSMAALITTSKLIIGLTSDALLKSKTHASILQSFSLRSSLLISFLKFFKPSLKVDIQPIDDVYGPTGWDPDIQALVVSKETLSGADKIKKWRAEKGLPALEVWLIDVVSATSESLESEDVDWLKENKLSSTEVRRWIISRQDEK